MSVNSPVFVSVFAVMLSIPVLEPTRFGQAAGGAVSFSMDVQPIFDLRCVRCHSGPSPAAGMDLTADNSYANLMDVPTTSGCRLEVPDSVRVVAFDPQNSMLWQKTKPDCDRCRSRMPNGTPGLGIIAPDEFAIIEQWILEGAPNN